MFDSILNTFQNLGVDWRLVIYNAFNFALVAAVIYYFGLRKVLRTMDERKAKIESGLAYAEEMKEKLAKAEEEQAEIIRQARTQSQEIIAQARNTAKSYQDEQAQETAAKVEQMLARGREAMELERRKAFDELKAEVARLVVLTTSKVLAREITPSEQSTLNARAAEELAKTN